MERTIKIMSKRLIQKDLNIRGRLLKLYRDCPKPSGWFGGVIRTKDGNVGMTGVCSVPVTVGMTLEAVVDVYDNPTYGTEYKASSVSVCLDDDASLIAYFSSHIFPGIGRKVAEKIVFQYGSDVVKKIKDVPDEVKRVCGLTDRQISILSSGVSSQTRASRLYARYPHLTEKWSMVLAGQAMSSDGFETQASTLFKQKFITFDSIVKQIDSNPYDLVKQGIPFAIVDAVALYDCHMSWDNEIRVDYVFSVELERFMNRTGSTYVNLMDENDTTALREAVSEALLHNRYDCRVSDVFMKNVMVRLARKGELCFDVTLRNESHLYCSTMRAIEQGIVSECMYHVLGGSLYDNFDDVSNQMLSRVKSYFSRKKKLGTFSLCKEQEDAVYFIIKHSLSCLQGGPGRGKTFVMKALANAWIHATGGSVVMLAPTGKAVGRMKESTGWEEAQTISRCLMMQEMRVDQALAKTCICDVGGSFSIAKSHRTLLIVDESSMIDFSEGFQVLNLFHDCHIVFVGDSSQLPPIEPGSFFRELIESDVVPVVHLQQNHRTESLEISENADRVLDGNIKMDVTQNFNLIPNDDELGVQYVVDAYQQYLLQGAEPSDILLMSPINKDSVGSVMDINSRLQALLNPEVGRVQLLRDADRVGHYYDTRGWKIPGTERHGLQFRIGDRVMNTKNHADGGWFKYQYNDVDGRAVERGYGYFNGDTGQILRYYTDGVNYDEPFLLIQLDDGRVVTVMMSEFNEWVFGYCITVHKSQGCEAKYGLMMLPKKLSNYWFQNSRFLNRNLLYTAITRAKSFFGVVGNMHAFRACIETPYEYHNTALSAYIKTEALPYQVKGLI